MRVIPDDNKNKHVEIDVETKYETDAAVLFNDGDEDFWIPKSVMENWSDIGDVGTATVEEWFAIKKELV